MHIISALNLKPKTKHRTHNWTNVSGRS